jgi:hypothetical protein
MVGALGRGELIMLLVPRRLVSAVSGFAVGAVVVMVHLLIAESRRAPSRGATRAHAPNA